MQRSRSFRLEKAVPASQGGGGAATYTFRANDGLPDRYQDRVSVKGWKLDAFNANPVILFNHDEFSALPIGKGRAYVEGDALFVDVQFDQGDEFAKRVESKVAGGFLNAVSVRYLMTKFTENELGGYDSLEQDLLEISVVTIPGNQRAVRVKALEADPVMIEQIAAAVAEKVIAVLMAEDEAEDASEGEPPAAPVENAKEAPEEKAPGALIQCSAGCGWDVRHDSCPDCGGEVGAWNVHDKPAATEAAAPEKPKTAPNLNEIAKEIASLALSHLKENN